MMKTGPQPSDREVLAGLVERVTYQNADNGFCVIRVKARGHLDLVTVVGHAAVISAGEWITAAGDWTNDRTHGQQFKARFLRTSAPTSVEGIEKYLASGMIRGIGPVYAKKLLRAFGEKVFDVIEAEPDRLREVDGIGPVRASRIAVGWAEQKVVREIMVFLHSHGVGSARAVRIYKTYGADAVQVMSENPYRLARDVRGIGFKTADAIAMKLGIEKTAMIRVRAGISYALTEAMDEGHRGLPTADPDAGNMPPVEVPLPTSVDRRGIAELQVERLGGNASAGRHRGCRWCGLPEERSSSAKSVFHFQLVTKSPLRSSPAALHSAAAGRARTFLAIRRLGHSGGTFRYGEVYPRLWNRGFAPENRTGDQHDAYSIAACLRQDELSGLLRPFGVRPKTIWPARRRPGDKSSRGLCTLGIPPLPDERQVTHKVELQLYNVGSRRYWLTHLRLFAHSGYKENGMTIYPTIVGAPEG
jgi:hypothetical protein